MHNPKKRKKRVLNICKIFKASRFYINAYMSCAKTLFVMYAYFSHLLTSPSAVSRYALAYNHNTFIFIETMYIGELEYRYIKLWKYLIRNTPKPKKQYYKIHLIISIFVTSNSNTRCNRFCNG